VRKLQIFIAGIDLANRPERRQLSDSSASRLRHRRHQPMFQHDGFYLFNIRSPARIRGGPAGRELSVYAGPLVPLQL